MPSRQLRIDRRPLIRAEEREIERGEQRQLQHEHYRDVAPKAGCHHDH